MTGWTRKITGTPNRKDVARQLSEQTSAIKAPTVEEAKEVVPEQEQPPTIDDAAPAAKNELERLKRQRGRASSIFAGRNAPTSSQGITAKTLLGS